MHEKSVKKLDRQLTYSKERDFSRLFSSPAMGVRK